MSTFGVVATGAGAALAVALPAALLAQVLDALADDGDAPVLVFTLVPVILGAMAFGGWVVGTRRAPVDLDPGASRNRPRTTVEGALAGLLAISVVQALGIARRLVADEAVAWGGVPAFLALGAALGAGGALLARRSASGRGRRP